MLKNFRWGLKPEKHSKKNSKARLCISTVGLSKMIGGIHYDPRLKAGFQILLWQNVCFYLIHLEI
jgi:hypothetical protein